VEHKKIIVVGGGPAGIMAAVRASQLQQDVTLIEKNSTLGRKLLLSGKGRCNLTNACDLDSFIDRFSGKGEFLRDAFKNFFYPQLMQFFQERGLALRIERQRRVFPERGKAGDILRVLEKELADNKVKIIFNSALKNILHREARVEGVLLQDGRKIMTDKVILATGGISYALTGSTGEGIKIAQAAGHAIVNLRPGLVPLLVKEKYPKILEGLTLENIRLKFTDGKRTILSPVGELLFTADGISGPLVLTLSGKIVDWLAEARVVHVEIDLKPALSKEQLDERLLREIKINSRKGIRKVLKELLPLRMIDLFLKIADLNPLRKVSQMTQKERAVIVELLKSFRMQIAAALPIEEAMITRGGIALKEINPRTMESRRIKGLYFCGEMLDLDADTGGFNLQAAFSTGYLAGESAALN
jgi:predicted Rossmann fold flavoprotein